VTEQQVTACVFGSTCIPSYSGRSNGVPLLRRFFARLTVLPLQCFDWCHAPYFRNFDDGANTVDRCVSPFSAKR